MTKKIIENSEKKNEKFEKQKLSIFNIINSQVVVGSNKILTILPGF